MTRSSTPQGISGRTLIDWCARAVFAGLIVGVFIMGVRGGYAAALREKAKASAIASSAAR